MVRPFLIVVAITLAGTSTTSHTASAQTKQSIPHSAGFPPTATALPMVSDPDGSLKREARVPDTALTR